MMGEAEGAVGIFDSGVGGLTVLRRIAERMPGESLVYLGDTARVPYGTKSADTVVRYAQGCARLLFGQGIKLLVVACNTASSYALEPLRDELPIPVLGVVEPGARRAVAATRNQRIGVIGTRGTIESGQYQKVIRSLVPEAEVHCVACPLFVPLAEEGWTEGPVTEGVARHYLQELAGHETDTLVLGCTHYPLLKTAIAAAVHPEVVLVDSAEATACVVEETLQAMEAMRSGESRATRRFLVTDDPATFARTGSRFLGEAVTDVEWVDLR